MCLFQIKMTGQNRSTESKRGEKLFQNKMINLNLARKKIIGTTLKFKFKLSILI